MVQNWKLSTTSAFTSDARDCIYRIRSASSEPEFGYKVQALAAHVLLRLGYRVNELNSSGHPDIVAIRDGMEVRIEVEAEISPYQARKLTEADFSGLVGQPRVVGYFALAVIDPCPGWIVVPAVKLEDRVRRYPRALLEALSLEEESTSWTVQYQRMLSDSCRHIEMASFSQLRRRALLGLGI